jgi:iron complex transport system ATP-binding protein
MKGLTVIMSLHELDLARKLSDIILCVGDRAIDKFGSPDQVFTEGYISKLFNISDELIAFAKEKNIL